MADALKVIVKGAILSYPHLAAPQKGEDGKADKFSAAFILLPDNPSIAAVEAALAAAAQAKWPGKWEAMKRSGKLHWILRGGDDSIEKGYPEGSLFFNARTEKRPGFVYSHAEPGSNPPRPALVADADIGQVFYPGAVVNVSVGAYAYDRPDKKGVSLGLNNIQFVRDGDRLDNRVAADKEFDAEMNAEPASLADLGITS